jgi:ribosomal protein S18 acetylase RimI-like enzyme
VPAVLEIARAAWRATYQGVLSAATIEDVLGRWYTSESIQRRLQGGLDVVERVAAIAGYAHHRDISPTVHEVFAIYVHPAVRGQGAGWALWQAVQAAAQQTKRSWIELWVLRDNAIGRRWYDRQGGAVVGAQQIQFPDDAREEVRYRFPVVARRAVRSRPRAG